MAIEQKELGQRLKGAREACGMTQDDVARQLSVSRSTVAQMELGNRAVTGIELSRLAYLFGKDLQSFVAVEAPDQEDALVAL
ncbi:MAG: helix-turn-helix transcriptional regulator, partial [Lentisphaeria bacterium]|nr:helix-turn-helix transcriptional regulator [Lentisphaeria bacterium]